MPIGILSRPRRIGMNPNPDEKEREYEPQPTGQEEKKEAKEKQEVAADTLPADKTGSGKENDTPSDLPDDEAQADTQRQGVGEPDVTQLEKIDTTAENTLKEIKPVIPPEGRSIELKPENRDPAFVDDIPVEDGAYNWKSVEVSSDQAGFFLTKKTNDSLPTIEGSSITKNLSIGGSNYQVIVIKTRDEAEDKETADEEEGRKSTDMA